MNELETSKFMMIIELAILFPPHLAINILSYIYLLIILLFRQTPHIKYKPNEAISILNTRNPKETDCKLWRELYPLA